MCGTSASNAGYTCVPIPTGADSGDCSAGCPGGYVCKLSGGQTQCVPATPFRDGGSGVDGATLDSPGSDGLTDATFDVRTDGPNASDAFRSSDVLDASGTSDAPNTDAVPFVSCNANSACSDGAKCVNGQCVAPSSLCSDTTQCVVSGEACVDGVCEPHCSASAPCPSGYGCDFTRGVCNVNPNPCTGSGKSSCLGGSTCVEGRCVAPCATGDGQAPCPSGQLCINGGCIPNEAAQFACKNDGQTGQLATTCGATEICLHHDCYAACDPEAGPNACSDPASACKQVVVTEGTYIVCATATNLGSDCDPAVGKYCPGGVCIDGYCR
jgi:hypothetical protein